MVNKVSPSIRHFLLATLLTLSPFATAGIAYDTITGDSLSGGAGGLGGVLQAGQQVTLDPSSSNVVVKFEVGLRLFPGGSESETFQIHFLALDGPGGDPGSVLWSSANQAFGTSTGTNQIFEFFPPSIVVPQTFVWVMEPTDDDPISDPSNILLGNSSVGASVGTAGPLWQQNAVGGAWIDLNAAPRLARVTTAEAAVPGPMPLALMAIAAALLLGIRTRS